METASQLNNPQKYIESRARITDQTCSASMSCIWSNRVWSIWHQVQSQSWAASKSRSLTNLRQHVPFWVCKTKLKIHIFICSSSLHIEKLSLYALGPIHKDVLYHYSKIKKQPKFSLRGERIIYNILNLS